MKFAPAAVAALMLSACAAPQPIPQCDFDPSRPIAERKSCDIGSGGVDSVRDQRTGDTRPDRAGNDNAKPTSPAGRDSRDDVDRGHGGVPGNGGSSQKPDPVTPPSTPPSEPPADHPDKPGKPDKPVHPDKPGKDKPGKPDKRHANASANNGKGGNYSHTGHVDNGKGRGRYKSRTR